MVITSALAAGRQAADSRGSGLVGIGEGDGLDASDGSLTKVCVGNALGIIVFPGATSEESPYEVQSWERIVTIPASPPGGVIEVVVDGKQLQRIRYRLSPAGASSMWPGGIQVSYPEMTNSGDDSRGHNGPSPFSSMGHERCALTRPQKAMLRSLIVNRPSRRRSMGLAGQLAKCWGIGRPDTHDAGYVVYEDADFKRAVAALKDDRDLVLPPATPAPKAVARRDVEGVVAAVPLHMGPSPWPGACSINFSRRDVLALDFEALLVSQNFELLQQLEKFSWLEQYIRGRRTLAIFVGSLGPFRRAVAESVVGTSNAPVLALFDFDPAGLLRAASTPRLETLCLPAWPDLERVLQQKKQPKAVQRAIAEHGTRLDAVTCQVVAPAWARMKQLGSLELAAFPR